MTAIDDEYWGTPEQERERNYLVGLSVTAAERLEWVEQMLEVAEAAGAQPKPREEWSRPLPPAERA